MIKNVFHGDEFPVNPAQNLNKTDKVYHDLLIKILEEGHSPPFQIKHI